MAWPARLTVRAAVSSVDLQIVDAQHRIFDVMLAANQRTQPGQQFLQLERFGQVVIGA
jgi:hypothetical protein